MKTKSTTAVYGWDHKEMEIPAGLSVRLATNLPEDSQIRFWLEELTPEMEANEEFESWYRNYGIGFTLDEVEYDKVALAKEYLEAVAGVAGNLSDAVLTAKTGANDARDRGLKVVRARDYAKFVLRYL